MLKSPATSAFLSRRRLCAAAALGLAGCASEPAVPPPLVLAVPPRLWEGESAALAERVSAQVVVDQRNGVLGLLETRRASAGLRPHPATSLPIADSRGRAMPIWELSNPDDMGAVAVLTPAEGDRRHGVRLLHPGKPPRTVREAAGEALWDHPISAMALSADGARLAFVAQPDPAVRYRPLNVGHLTVLELALPDTPGEGAPAWRPTSDATAAGLRYALGQRPAWLVGSTRLLYAAAGPRGRASTANPPPQAQLQPDPEIRLLDLSTGTDEFFTHGHSPVASSDGLSVLVARGPGIDLFQVEVQTRRERAVRRRHGLGLPLALIQGRYLIFTGASHPQAPAGQTTHNSPLVGPKAMRALKVMDIDSREVLTLLEGVDPRRRVAAAAMP